MEDKSVLDTNQGLVEFLKRLRRVSNHLSDEEHSRLHLAIERVAKSTFGKVKDFEVEDWLDTETMHRTMKGRNHIEWADYRCDTDRTMFGVLSNLVRNGQYLAEMAAFREGIEPMLDGFTLSPAFTIDSLSVMPWDAAHVLHMVLGRQLAAGSLFYVGAKVFKRSELNEYLEAVRMMDSYYYNFGLELMDKSLKQCNSLLQKLYGSLDTYLSRARVKTSERYELSSALHRDIPRLIASL